MPRISTDFYEYKQPCGCVALAKFVAGDFEGVSEIEYCQEHAKKGQSEPGPMTLSFRNTNRGFPRAEFSDRYGSECSIQESSLATEACIWLGVDKPFSDDTQGGYTRMHLTQDMVLALLPALVKFAYTGELPNG